MQQLFQLSCNLEWHFSSRRNLPVLCDLALCAKVLILSM